MSGQPTRIAIAGGGIAGLAAAIALAKQGIATTIFERRAGAPEEGAGIQIGPNGTRILSELGVAPLLQEYVGTPAALRVRNGASGRELAALPLGDWIEQRHGSPYWTAHRADLHGALHARIAAEPLVEIGLGATVRGYTEGERLIIHTEQGDDPRLFSALIGADGLRSHCREQIAGIAARPEPVGKAAYRTIVPADRFPDALSRCDVYIWLSPGAHAVHYPVRGGAEYAVVVIADDREAVSGWSAPASAETVAAASAGFATPLKALVASAESWRKWSLHSLPPLPIWSKGRATLIGDAAHPMLPFLAQGAVMALEDAIALARHCKAYEADIAAAFAHFERERRGRAARVVEASRRNGEVYQLGGIAAAARNGVLKLAPGAKLMAQLDWLYGAKF